MGVDCQYRVVRGWVNKGWVAGAGFDGACVDGVSSGGLSFRGRFEEGCVVGGLRLGVGLKGSNFRSCI